MSAFITKSPRILSEDLFGRVLCRERKRSERLGSRLLLLLLDVGRVDPQTEMRVLLAMLPESVLLTMRDTDACGWLKTDKYLCLLFTEKADGTPSEKAVELKVRDLFDKFLAPSLCERIGISFLSFPEDLGGKQWSELGEGFNMLFYPDRVYGSGDVSDRTLKRVMDLLISGLALLLCAPLLLSIALLVKMTSPGPILFRQIRVGQFGKPFTFLKFRTMQANSDIGIHRQYMKDFIANNIPAKPATGGGEVIFKIQHDPRLTRFGNFLRKTSLDELPQLFNVLKGEMSLVGPRPPIPYEVDHYQLWHRYRILTMKPGITGLWQVKGRSRTTFEGMVRLDLEYIQTWSLWLDVKLLLATPVAVLKGLGAF